MGACVLTRKPGQSIHIHKKACPTCSPTGEDIQVITYGSNGQDMKLGIDAPLNYDIKRDNLKPTYNKMPKKQLELFEAAA